MTRSLPALLAALTLSFTVAACGSGSGPDTGRAKGATAASTPAATATKAAVPAGGCQAVDAQAPVKRSSKKPTSTLPAGQPHIVTLQTSCGPIQVTLDVKRHPKTASSFASLVKSGFYDGLGFVRVVPGFVIQGGDPHGDGSGGPSYQVVEPPGDNAAYRKGVVAMAKTATDPPGASGSQFFIVLGADAGLPPEYAIAGRVTKGLEVAQAIGAIPPAGGTDGPLTRPVLIQKATLG